MSILRQIVQFFQNLGKSESRAPGKVANTSEMEMEMELKRGMRGF